MIFDKAAINYMHLYGEVQKFLGGASAANELGYIGLEKSYLDKSIVAIDEYNSNVIENIKKAKKLSNMNDLEKYCTDRLSEIKSKA
ncbi:MAG: hypothetical protein ABIF18_03400 [archaeon]